jgi:hypothetical protein
VVRARAAHDELEGRSRHEYIGCFWLATSAAAAGLQDDAIAFARRAVGEGDPFAIHAAWIPLWDRIREDSRYPEVVRGLWGSART